MGGGGGFSLNAMGGGASIGGSNFSQSSSVDIALPNNQDLTQVQVSMSLNGGAGPNTTFSGNASIWSIRIEVQVVNCFANVTADRWRGEYFNNTNLSGSPSMVRDDGDGPINLNFGDGSPSTICGVGVDSFSARWTRTVNFASGPYRFTVTGDDGVRLYVDGLLKIDAWVMQGPTTYTADMWLSTGNHEIKLEYFEGGGPGQVSLSWTTVCQRTVAADRWKDEYFNNQNLSGSPALIFDGGDGFLNPNWGSDSPSSACGVPADNFSARFTRTVNFAQGIYRFTTSADNGVRLYVDGYLRGDQWGDLPPNTYRADVFLSAGLHEIKLEFIEYTGGASFSLSWTPVASPSGNMAFGKSASQSSTPLSNATADRAIDGNLSGNWADNSVNHTGYEHQPWWQVDLGSVQKIGEIVLRNRTDCCSDRLSDFYVLVSDNPFSSTDLTTTINQPGVSNYYTANSVGVSKEIGVYRSGRYVRVQLAGDNYLHLAEVEVRGLVSRNLAFGKSVSQSSTAFGGDAFRAVDSNTSGNWNDNSVTHTNLDHQPWWQVDLGSVQQIGAVILWNRTDGSSDRLSDFYVLVSDAPFNSTDLTATINQAGVSNYYTAGPVGAVKEIGVYRSGRYVRVQLAGDNWLHMAEVEVRNGASLSGCVASVPADHWKGEYFNNTTLTGSPAMVRNDGSGPLTFNFGEGTPSAECGVSAEYFSARWTRTVNFPAGTYRFSLTGDDGVRLYVDGQLKIDAWILQGPTTYTADVTFSAGPHDIKLEFFDASVYAVAFLSWRLLPIPNCMQNAPLVGAAPPTGAGESVATTPASEAPKRCGQKSSD